MIPCPTCGSQEVPCPCETESRIAAWIDEAAGPSLAPAASDQVCTACGYEGEMPEDGQGTSCPACGVVLPGRRSDMTLRVIQRVDCPECGRQIGVTAEDAGKTVVCPGCSYFLGTPKARAGRGGR
jgi:predicted RNA-binding Zn-ribbon protein involved in translation (DUF1610 family)